MTTRTDIPKTPRGRLLLAMEALSMESGELSRLLGWQSQRIANYTSGRNMPPPPAVVLLGNYLQFTALWFYHGLLEKGATTPYLKKRILKLLNRPGGWQEPPPHDKLGRPPKVKKAQSSGQEPRPKKRRGKSPTKKKID